jgi:hypothetical protein
LIYLFILSHSVSKTEGSGCQAENVNIRGYFSNFLRLSSNRNDDVDFDDESFSSKKASASGSEAEDEDDETPEDEDCLQRPLSQTEQAVVMSFV